MNIIEIIAVFFTLICVILTIKENKLCWLFGIIGTIFYGILFFQNKIWGNMSLQLIFLTQSILGWYNWNKPSKFKIKWLDKEKLKITYLSVFVIAIITFLFLDKTGGESPLFDSITTSLSIIGTILLAYKKIDSWILWIIADIIFVIFFYSCGLYLSSIIYFVFLLLSIKGLLGWKKIPRT